MAGKVQKVDFPLDKDGRSRGFAVIEYDHPVEAVQAISMLHNQVLFDRHMTVRMDRGNENLKLPEGLKSVGMGLGTNGEPLRNVSVNLPSVTGNQGGQIGAGILGAVPNSALQVANALSSLNNPLTSLTNQSVLQAANLTSLLGNGLSNTDLSLANSLVSSSLAHQNQSQMSGPGNVNQNMPSNPIQPFSRSDNYSNQGSNYNQAYQNNQSRGGGGGGGGSGGSGGGYQPFDGQKNNFGNNMMRSPQTDNKNMSGGSFNRKMLISNVSGHRRY